MKMETDSYEENIPFGVIFFFDDFEYSEASNFCSDFDIDDHEIYNFLGFPVLVFYSNEELRCCIFFCRLSGFNFECLRRI